MNVCPYKASDFNSEEDTAFAAICVASTIPVPILLALIALCAILYFITKLGAIALPVSLIFYEISSIIMITIFLIYNEYRQHK